MEVVQAREPWWRVDHASSPLAVAARHLGLPLNSVRWWALGSGAHPPVIRIADPQRHLLSFRNVAEIHVLSGLLSKDHDRVPLAIVRAALTLLEEHLDSPHPLCEPTMLADGKDFFAATFGMLTGASPRARAAISATLATYLERIEFNVHGVPVRLLIFTRRRPEGPGYVMLDPNVQAGEPCMTNTEVTSAAVSERFASGESIAVLARAYGRAPEEIEEAVRYETR